MRRLGSKRCNRFADCQARLTVIVSSGELNLGTGDVGDVVDVSGNSFQLTQINPRVWRNV